MRRASGLALFGVGMILLVAAGAVAVAPPQTSMTPAPSRSYVPGELIVRLRAYAPDARTATLRRLGAAADSKLGDTGYTRIKLQDGEDIAQAIARYRDDPAIDAVQPNYRYVPQSPPNDTRFGEQWALKKMNLETAWDSMTDCSSTVVAVIDTGVNYTHVDLAENMWDGAASGYPRHGYDFVHDDDDPMPADGDSHGTHVAGVIAAVGNNGVGTSGVCWRARIMALRVMDAAGGRTDTVIRGINYAVANGARIINLSLGGDGKDDALGDAIEYARRKGVVVVTAGGNGGRDIDESAAFYPCSFASDNIVCVAAVDEVYDFAWFSNFGARSIDVAAPGTNALSTRSGDSQLWSWDSGWQFCNGAWTTPAVCSTGQYANDADDRLSRTVDLSAEGILGAGVAGSYLLKTADKADVLAASYDRDGLDPFDTNGGIVHIPDASQVSTFGLSLHDCLTPSWRAALRFTSGDAGTDSGPKLFLSMLNLARAHTAVFDYAGGTSMSTAYASGVAALVWAYNPNYTYADVVDVVKNSGNLSEKLRSRTASGRAVDASGALRYINAPRGLTVTGQ